MRILSGDVLDNTNRDKATRKHYVTLAKKHEVSIRYRPVICLTCAVHDVTISFISPRCIYFTGSVELAWHNNLYRAFNLPPALAATEQKRGLLPYSAFTGFRADFEEPSVEEGFAEVRKVNFIFEGDEEARRRWSMWLQIDGK